MIFFIGMFGGMIITLTIVIISAIFCPKQIRSFLFPREVNFSQGMIYRKGQPPERVG